MTKGLRFALAIGAMLGGARPAIADDDPFAPVPVFALDGAPPGGAAAARGGPAYLSGARIAAVDDGALVIDADSGALVRVDGAGATRAQLVIARDAGLLAYDDTARMAYVADRRGDRVVVVRIGAALEVTASWRTAAEPYGVALTPDRATVLVTHVADRMLVAYDPASGRERWRIGLAAEPRGISVSPDGTRALVAYPGAEAIDEIALDEHRAIHVALPRASEAAQPRGAFAATFLGDGLAVAPFQLSKPDSDRARGTYGGSQRSPITHHLALFGLSGRRRAIQAQIRVSVPRAVVWDAARDALYVAGLGSDEILQVVRASQVDVRAGVARAVGGTERCGPDGLAIASDGNLLVWCAFTRSLARVAVVDGKGKLAAHWRTSRGPEVAASALDANQHLGMVVFHTAQMPVSVFAGLTCASCHYEGRADGLSWRVDDHALQTPVLAGRIASTAPYGWDGHAKDLAASLRSTIVRLDGAGLGTRQRAALAAYLEAMPAVRTPTRDPDAIARGKATFEALGCRGCHDGAAYTDQERHRLSPAQRAVDTPSLLGLAASAPYFHDGSAATLEVLLRDRGAVHGMSDPARTLSDPEVSDLVVFLESLSGQSD